MKHVLLFAVHAVLFPTQVYSTYVPAGFHVLQMSPDILTPLISQLLYLVVNLCVYSATLLANPQALKAVLRSGVPATTQRKSIPFGCRGFVEALSR